MFHLDGGFIIKSFAFIVISASTLFFAIITGPAIETAYFPVVGPLKIDRIEPIDDKSSSVWASYAKYRDCAYLATAWYDVGVDGGLERVWMESTPYAGESIVSRPLGLNRVGPWTVAMPADKVRNKSVVEVFHQCTLLWVSKSIFYP